MVSEGSFYVRPKQAWKKLQASMNMSQPVYIYGSATFGKTELIKQFLNKRRYLYCSCTEDSFLETITAAEKSSITVIVIDDLSLLRNDEARQQIIRLAERKDIRLFLLSRSSVPEWLFTLYVKSGFLIIEEADLRIPYDRLSAYFSENDVTFTKEQLDFIYERIEGNAYAAAWILRKMKEGRVFDDKLRREVAEIFLDYAEEHVIAQWDSDIAEFLTRASVVDTFDEELAGYITGNHQVGTLIKKAGGIGNFLYYKDNGYRVMPFLLRTLRRRAKTIYGEEQIREYQYNAGLYYETHDMAVEALSMYEKSGSHDRIRELLIRNSRQNPGVGHYYEMRQYYLALSEAEIGNNPVLMSGMSMLYALLLQKEKSEYWYGRLKEFTEASKGGESREAMARLAFLDISLPQRSVKNIIEVINKAFGTVYRNIPIPEFSVTGNMPSILNGGKDFCCLTYEDRSFAEKYGELAERLLGRQGKGFMDCALAESLYEKGADTYEVLSLLSRTNMQTEAGGAKEIEFVAAGIQVRLNILYGNEKAAKEILTAFRNRATEEKAVKLLPNIDAIGCRIALYESNKEAVAEWLKEAPDEDKEYCAMERYRYMTKVRCYIAEGSYIKAYSLLEKMRYYADFCDRTYLSIEIDLLSALVKYRMNVKGLKNNLSGSKNSLKSCLLKADRLAFRRLIAEEGAAVLEPLEQLKKNGELLEQVNQEWLEALLQETRKMAKQYPMYLKGNIAEMPDFPENALEILRLQAQGRSLLEIAGELAINIDTVKYHTKQNYRKLGASSKTDAVLAARNLGIL